MADRRDDTAITQLVAAHCSPSGWATVSELDHIESLHLTVDWARAVPDHKRNLRIAEWYIECHLVGGELLEKSVDVKPEVRGGRAVIKGTGFTVSQTLIELADSSGVREVAENFDIDQQKIVEMLNGLAMLLSKPFRNK